MSFQASGSFARTRAQARPWAVGLLALALWRWDGDVKAAPGEPSWVEASNAHAQLLLQVNAAFAPEEASRIGVPGVDERVADLEPGFDLRQAEALGNAATALQARLAAEPNQRVRQDLEILLDAARRQKDAVEVRHRLLVPLISPARLAFAGLQVLLDEQSPPERRAAASTRLRRYVGLEPGSHSVFQRAAERYTERSTEERLLAPDRGLVEKEIRDSPTYAQAIRDLFAHWKTTGVDDALAAFDTATAGYVAFLNEQVLPHARTDSRLPPELYTLELRDVGVDMPVEELTNRARATFVDIQTQMAALAPRVARDKGIKATDYRDVIRALKKRQLVGKAILPHYQQRARDLEDIIRRGRIVTLPDRPMLIEIASPGESAAVPAPHLRGPRLIGNAGERAVFSLPMQISGPGGATLAFDDFTFEAASWTLTAHEGRPGHELQFARIIDEGVSIARAVFAFNSVNVEGWALYAEAEAQPFEPPDGQLIALQHRLMRAARAILDPSLQAGTVTKEDAFRLLTDEVLLSRAMAQQEVDRYTFLAPGQATSYFVGYSRLLEIRAAAQVALGPRFDRLKFNDFVIAQGLLPAKLLRTAVENEFIPSQRE